MIGCSDIDFVVTDPAVGNAEVATLDDEELLLDVAGSVVEELQPTATARQQAIDMRRYIRSFIGRGPVVVMCVVSSIGVPLDEVNAIPEIPRSRTPSQRREVAPHGALARPLAHQLGTSRPKSGGDRHRPNCAM